eukprot:TRINITY_DN124853_c0_g1_i1.p1 TRINITY_DN124853_c0_g1~~TRINITY_DN124853_c0_g1_i1.p1  ORF type:complete len:200 (+),score=21.86 TRINITY_DN124853_c0_g1_i1:132-731(+)
MSMTVAQMGVYMEQIGEESRQARRHDLRSNPIGQRIEREKQTGEVMMPYGAMTVSGNRHGVASIGRRASPSMSLTRGDMENPWLKRSMTSGKLFNHDPYLESTCRFRVPRPLTGPPDKPPSFLYGGQDSGVTMLMSMSGTAKGFLPNMEHHQPGRHSPLSASASDSRLRSQSDVMRMPLAGVGSNSTSYGLLFPRGPPM